MAMCEDCQKVPATCRRLIEADSFGQEYVNLCDTCDERARQAASRGICDWCQQESDDLGWMKDPDEGLCGAMYRVCGSCRQKIMDAIEAEYSDLDEYWDGDECSGEERDQ